MGYVQFTQSYDDIAADACNYDVEDITNGAKTTTWNYINAQINHDEDNNYGLRAFYSAKKKNETTRNNGMHKLDITRRSKSIPTVMEGSFGDVSTFDTNSPKSASDKYLSCGEIQMFRMTAEQEEYLYEEDAFDPQKLSDMLEGKVKFKSADSKAYIDAVNEIKARELANPRKKLTNVANVT